MKKSLNAKDAFMVEKNIQKYYIKDKYIPNVRFKGFTECFNYNIIEDLLLKGLIYEEE